MVQEEISSGTVLDLQKICDDNTESYCIHPVSFKKIKRLFFNNSHFSFTEKYCRSTELPCASCPSVCMAPTPSHIPLQVQWLQWVTWHQHIFITRSPLFTT